MASLYTGIGGGYNSTMISENSQSSLRMASGVGTGILSCQNNNRSSFIAYQLKRDRFRSMPWGFALSLFEEYYLIVASVQHDILNRNCIWGYSASEPPDPSVMFNTEIPVPLFQKYFERLPPRHPSSSSSSSLLLPGDMILAINGRSVASFANLKQISSYLKQNSQLMLAIVRFDNAVLSVPSIGTNVHSLDHSEKTLLGAYRSYQVFKDIVPRQYLPLIQDQPYNAGRNPTLRPPTVIETSVLPLTEEDELSDRITVMNEDGDGIGIIDIVPSEDGFNKVDFKKLQQRNGQQNERETETKTDTDFGNKTVTKQGKKGTRKSEKKEKEKNSKQSKSKSNKSQQTRKSGVILF